jgi:hypothetical protein
MKGKKGQSPPHGCRESTSSYVSWCALADAVNSVAGEKGSFISVMKGKFGSAVWPIH